MCSFLQYHCVPWIIWGFLNPNNINWRHPTNRTFSLLVSIERYVGGYIWEIAGNSNSPCTNMAVWFHQKTKRLQQGKLRNEQVQVDAWNSESKSMKKLGSSAHHWDDNYPQRKFWGNGHQVTKDGSLHMSFYFFFFAASEAFVCTKQGVC